MKGIKRLLIANRGEIACRVIRSCNRLGIESVAVFSDADRHALHVQQADLACYIGGSAASESYLNAHSIMEAALKVKADAIHPGYGFLSESTELISLCQSNGVIFVGPSVESIADMGSKIEAKAIAQALAIPTVPGYNGECQDQATLLAQGDRIGYPLLIKASAGGGGKGMRIVHSSAQFNEALGLARQESLKAFGDDRVLLEKYIVRPRHIEVQLLGDSAGKVVHLFDRECSIQRNYQKVIEEAPVNHLSTEVRQGLFDCAVRLGQHLQYQGAGTVEFIVDADSGNAYFLEMNTRLQVEHPTTEWVTGIDIVEWQIRVAQGESLPFEQRDIVATGHAIEARINAEDPANNYLPEIGRIQLYQEPVAEGLRIDSGVELGSEITPFYDSMVAKIIAFGSSRGMAAQRLLQGLNNFAIGGVKTNQEFLTSLITRPAFHQELTTQYISQQFPNGWRPWGEVMHMAIAAAAYAQSLQTITNLPVSGTPWQTLGSWRLTAPAGTPAVNRVWLEQNNELVEIKLIGSDCQYQVTIGDEVHSVVLSMQASIDRQAMRWQVELEGTRRSLAMVIEGDHVSLSSPRLSRSYRFLSLEDTQLGDTAATRNASNIIRAQMPGLITDVLVKEGDVVEEGSIAIVMEAMKLIQNLSCPCAGKITQVLCMGGDNVAEGSLLIEIEPIKIESIETQTNHRNTNKGE